MKTILVPLLGHGGDGPALELACRVAAPHGGHITAIHVRPNTLDELSSLSMGAGAMTQAMFDTLDAENRARAAAAKKAFDAFCRERKIAQVWEPGDVSGVTAGWEECVGRFKDEILFRGRRHELLVMGRDVPPFGVLAADLADIVFGCGRPLLLAPQTLPEITGRTIAIAWKNSIEAAHALTAAMPMIALAQKVVVLSVPEDGTGSAAGEAKLLAAQLRWIPADVEVGYVWEASGEIGEALADGARTAQADMLVMGGYGHSRAREFILGGATRELLRDCSLPLLIVH